MGDERVGWVMRGWLGDEGWVGDERVGWVMRGLGDERMGGW